MNSTENNFGLVELKEVTKIHQMGSTQVTALNCISLCVRSGEYVAITGTSGSGKSTLLQIIGCLDRPTTGRYVLNGLEVGERSDNELSHIRNAQIGFVFQSFHLMAQLNVIENIELPLLYRNLSRQQRVKIIDGAIAKVGLSKRRLHKPYELSGGERQRVAIARALVGDPSLLLADEPTGNLDQKTGDEIMSTIEMLNSEGVTVLLVTHDLDRAARAGRMIEMKDGQFQ